MGWVDIRQLDQGYLGKIDYSSHDYGITRDENGEQQEVRYPEECEALLTEADINLMAEIEAERQRIREIYEGKKD